MSHEGHAWEAVGVWSDRISSQIAGWQLPLNSNHPAATVAAAYQAANEPTVLTLGILAANDSPLVAPPPVDDAVLWVVEGISVLAAIAAHRPPQPVICRGGTPSVAVMRVTDAAAAAGWRIVVSSDFEPGGLRGAVAVLRRARPSAFPWRLTAADYLSAQPDGDPFIAEQVPDTPRNPALADAMRQRCQRVSEESRLELLLTDLRAERPAPSTY